MDSEEAPTAYRRGLEEESEDKMIKKVRAIASATSESVVRSMESEIAQSKRDLQKARQLSKKKGKQCLLKDMLEGNRHDMNRTQVEAEDEGDQEAVMMSNTSSTRPPNAGQANNVKDA